MQHINRLLGCNALSCDVENPLKAAVGKRVNIFAAMQQLPLLDTISLYTR